MLQVTKYFWQPQTVDSFLIILLPPPQETVCFFLNSLQAFGVYLFIFQQTAMHCNQYFNWVPPQALLSFFLQFGTEIKLGVILFFFFPWKMKYKWASKEEYKHLLTCFLSSAPIWYFVTFRNWNFAGFLGASSANREGQALKQEGSLWLLNMTN